ncbi:pentapeptide repeat-containing protein [Devosia sp. CN2-171]|uniref:pentapeptide repeat-containing protein n=1 Tax=Devosia sp. CN2-171 TaxID=3400909 RepID=UPI003BF8EE9D
MTEAGDSKPAKPDGGAIGPVGLSIIVFFLGVVVGIPVANFGADVLVRYAGEVFAILFAVFLVAVLIAALIALFRKQIWSAIFKRAEFEVDRFARPLADVAQFAAEQKVQEATGAARDLAELVLARYAWVSTRRWLMATITALIAAIAALAGSALLFQQNQLLRTQIGLMGDQNSRIEEQNRFIQSQIELGEAQRSTSIVPEILEIGSLLAQEVQQFQAGAAPSIASLSPGLRARIIAATTAARPYRYLRNPLTDLDEQLLMSSGLLRRTDLAASATIRQQLDAVSGNVQFAGAQSGVMSDRPLSPERGQILALLIYNGLTDFSELNGADFSFAEVRAASMGSSLRFRFASLRFSNFDRQLLVGAEFDGAHLEHARFRNANINYTRFGVGELPSISGGEGLKQGAQLSGADFSGAILKHVAFDGSRGFGINFDGGIVHQVTFGGTSMAGSTFRGTIVGVADFTGADLKSVDLDGAIVFDAAFLDTVAAQAAPESFVRDRFEIAAITPDEFARHPLWSDAWLDGLEAKQAYRITRVGAFE